MSVNPPRGMYFGSFTWLFTEPSSLNLPGLCMDEVPCAVPWQNPSAQSKRGAFLYCSFSLNITVLLVP